MANGKSKVVVIVGPTGSGKTDLAVRLARTFHGECIAADSRTVYRGMDIGTAKPIASENRTASLPTRSSRGAASAEGPPASVEDVPHWLLDIRDPSESYSVAEFKADAERLIEEVTARGKLPIVVGGTGLYIQSLVENLTLPDIPAQPKFRESFERKSLPELFTLLETLDPDAAATIDRKNKRRVIRALEVCVCTGQPFSALRTRGESKFDVLQIGVQRTRASLYRRIDARICAMFRQGLIAEVEHLLWRYGPDIESLRGLIYREVIEYLHTSENGAIPKTHDREKRGYATSTHAHRMALHALQQRIMYANHRYARHQLMWFKRDTRIHWVRTPQQAERLVREFLKTLSAPPRSSGRCRGLRFPSSAS